MRVLLVCLSLLCFCSFGLTSFCCMDSKKVYNNSGTPVCGWDSGCCAVKGTSEGWLLLYTTLNCDQDHVITEDTIVILCHGNNCNQANSHTFNRTLNWPKCERQLRQNATCDEPLEDHTQSYCQDETFASCDVDVKVGASGPVVTRKCAHDKCRQDVSCHSIDYNIDCCCNGRLCNSRMQLGHRVLDAWCAAQTKTTTTTVSTTSGTATTVSTASGTATTGSTKDSSSVSTSTRPHHQSTSSTKSTHHKISTTSTHHKVTTHPPCDRDSTESSLVFKYWYLILLIVLLLICLLSLSVLVFLWHRRSKRKHKNRVVANLETSYFDKTRKTTVQTKKGAPKAADGTSPTATTQSGTGTDTTKDSATGDSEHTQSPRSQTK